MGVLETSLYRLLLRHIRSIDTQYPGGVCDVIRPFNSEAWLSLRGSPTLTPRKTVDVGPFGVVDRLAADVLLSEVRRRFREGEGAGKDGVGTALEAIRALDEQRFLRERYRCQVTDDVVRICSIAQHVGDNRTLDSFYDADGDAMRQYFSYRITVENISSSKTVKIVDRSWRIFNDKGRIAVEVPRSPGLVGLTPTLAPGGTFEYYSGTDLESDRGHMEGSFGVVVVEGGGDKFDAVVPRLDFR